MRVQAGRGRPVVLSFFASWCPDCRQELKSMAGLAASAGAGVEVIGIDVNDDAGAARQLLVADRITYPVGVDNGAGIADLYGVVGLPTTVYLDAAHRIVGRDRGRRHPRIGARVADGDREGRRMTAPVAQPLLEAPTPEPALRPAGRARRPRRRVVVGLALVAAAALVGAAGGKLLAASRHTQASLADIMSLSPLPQRPSPAFTLTDQHGATVSLSQYRGKAVVLEFMDPRCTDICPIVSQEFRVAYQHLGATASDVVFLAVNVNQYHEDLASVQQFTNEQHLDQLPNWHFLTGTTPVLAAQWAAYGEAVEPNPTGDVVHGSLMYFIDPEGRQRYLATPQDSTQNLTQWGRGIALYASSLVPAR